MKYLLLILLIYCNRFNSSQGSERLKITEYNYEIVKNRQLRSFKNIVELSINFLNKDDIDYVISEIKKFKSLKSLTIESSTIKNQSFSQITQIENLNFLNLSKTSITYIPFKIKRMENLQTLHLCELGKLDSTSNLHNLNNLNILNLQGTEILLKDYFSSKGNVETFGYCNNLLGEEEINIILVSQVENIILEWNPLFLKEKTYLDISSNKYFHFCNLKDSVILENKEFFNSLEDKSHYMIDFDFI